MAPRVTHRSVYIMFCTGWCYTVYISNWGWNDKYKNRQVDAKWAIDKPVHTMLF